MIRTLVIVAIFAALAAGGAWLADRPGSVTLEWQGWRVDTTVAFLVFALAVLSVVLAGLFDLFASIGGAPGRFAASRRARRRDRGYRALTQGMVAVAAGDAAEARRQSKRADALLADPPLTMLLAAQAAQLGGDEAAARRYFTAMLERPETAFLGVRGLLMQAERAGDRAEMRRLIERAHEMRPATPWVITSLLDDQARSGHWHEAEETLARAMKARALDRDEARRKQVAIDLALAAAERDSGRLAEARAHARKAQRADPDSVPAAIARAKLELEAGHARTARKLVEAAWPRTPHPALVRVFREARDGDAGEQYQRVESLTQPNARHPESRLARAEAALDARLWAIAARELAALDGEGQPDARVCRLHARLAAEDSGDSAAERDWLVRAAAAPPGPAWLCAQCGAEAPEWSALCPACGAFATIGWAVPERAPAALPDRGARAALPTAGDGTGADAGEAAPRPAPTDETGPPEIDAPARGA